MGYLDISTAAAILIEARGDEIVSRYRGTRANNKGTSEVDFQSKGRRNGVLPINRHSTAKRGERKKVRYERRSNLGLALLYVRFKPTERRRESRRS